MLSMQRHVRWRHLEDGHEEALAIEVAARHVRARGQVFEPSGEEAFRYEVLCDEAWAVRSIDVARAGQALSLSSDGQGHWKDGAGAAVEALAGCIDVDIQDTPSTNTIPIRRLGLAQGRSCTIPVAYVPLPSLRPVAVRQTYTCLRAGRQYRYEGHPPGFAADLRVDADGWVVTYPGLFQRL